MNIYIFHIPSRFFNSPLTITKPSFFLSLQFTSTKRQHSRNGSQEAIPRTGKFDSKSRRRVSTTTKEEEVEEEEQTIQIETDDNRGGGGSISASNVVGDDDGYLLLELPGEKPDFWEGPQWDVLGFLV